MGGYRKSDTESASEFPDRHQRKHAKGLVRECACNCQGTEYQKPTERNSATNQLRPQHSVSTPTLHTYRGSCRIHPGKDFC